ncbi:helix-turn-helix domain-containing protein [Paractinoplanes lichenicola]|uniref:Helix-turn-helix domain-containing protein n=1 Tax=Paractinoplanes lichenicola TaxID=2802976 RepID=A0ABS1VR79_9ACTN|nr:helix-turn-helix domain-containing protein [Actinoplanes lichenicola]MBL7257222.1 helix-turn-helix domain-containing protein [Actinoplanes lichenicola]
MGALNDGMGERLRTLRLERGLSQTTLARSLVSASYISLIEAGKRIPEREVLHELARRLGTSVDYLETGVDTAALQEQELAVRYADLSLANGQTDDALRAFRDLSSAAVPSVRFRAGWGVTRALELRGELPEALATIEPLITESRADRFGEPTLLVLLNARCRMYREAGDVDLSITYGEEALAEAARLGLRGTEDEVRLATTLVGCYWDRGDLTRARLLSTEVIDRAEQHGTHRAKGSAYWNASLVAEAEGRRQLAITLAERALGLLGETMEEHGLARLRMVLGWLLLRTDPPDLDRASALLTKARTTLAEVGADVDLARCDLHLARLQLMRGAYDESLSRIAQAFPSLDSLPVDRARAHLLRGRALIAQGLAGEDDLRTAENLIAGAHDRRRVAELWRELAETWESVGEPTRALAAYRALADSLGVVSWPTPVRRPSAHTSTPPG